MRSHDNTLFLCCPMQMAFPIKQGLGRLSPGLRAFTTRVCLCGKKEQFRQTQLRRTERVLQRAIDRATVAQSER